MLINFVELLLALSLLVTVLALIFAIAKPEIGFLLSLIAIPLWVALAYGANMVEVVDVATDTTKVYYDKGIQFLAIGGLLFTAINIWLSSTMYAGGEQ